MIPEYYGPDREILGKVLQWRRAGHEVALITVLRTWGSSPRPPGSLLAIRDDGLFEGSVSGGCVEEDLVGRIRDGDLKRRRLARVAYGVTGDDAGRFGLPCGGRLELLLERPPQDSIQALLRGLDAGELIRRRVCLNTGEVSLHEDDGGAEFRLEAAAVEQVFGPAWRLLLVGAGQLALYTARMALMLGYEVVVCDPREEHRRGWELPGVALRTDMPDDCVRELADHPRAVVVTLAHDPKVDDMALMEALGSRAFYVGALGSRRSQEQRRRRLAQLDLSPEQTDRLHGPVGLAIGSREPAEIALSILAGITRARRLGK